MSPETRPGGRFRLPITVALLLLGLAPVLWALRSGRTFASNDFGAELIPALGSLRGHVPFVGAPSWNPTLFGGAPAEVLPTMARYPLNLGAYVLPPEMAAPLLVGLHLGIAALTAWWFARRVAKSTPAAGLLGALVYAFGGALWLQGKSGHVVVAAAWLPAVMTAGAELAAAATDLERRRWCRRLGALVAMSLLVGGSPSVWFFTAAGTAVVIDEALRRRRGDGLSWRRAIGEAAPWLALALVAGAMIAAPAVLPWLEAIRGGARERLTLAESGAYSLLPNSLPRIWAPDLLLGGPWSWPGYVERWSYLGILTLPLVALGSRDPRGRFLLTNALLCLVLAMGLLAPLHYLSYFLVPGYAHLRAPGRWFLLAALFAAGVAARGADRVLAAAGADTAGGGDPAGGVERASPATSRGLLAAAAAIVLLAAGSAAAAMAQEGDARRSLLLASTHAVFAAAWLFACSRRRIGARAGAAVAAALLVVDLLPLPFRQPPAEPIAALDPPAVFASAAERAGGARLSHDDASAPLPYNGGGRWGYRNARGYSQVVPRLYSRLLDRDAPPERRFLGEPARTDPALLRLLGVGVWVGDARAAPPDGFEPRPFAEAGGLAAWSAAFEPLVASIVARADVVAEGDAERAAALALDPAASAVVTSDVGLSDRAPGSAGRARVTRISSDRIRVDAEATTDGLLVLAEAWHPRWKAWIDGRPAEIVRADAIWQGVVLPAGPHTVEFRCRPAVRGWMWLTSAAGVLALAATRIGRRPRTVP